MIGPKTGGRSPTLSELRALIQGCSSTETNGPCMAKDTCPNSNCNDQCSGCNDILGCYWDFLFKGICNNIGYWSSTIVQDNTGSAWFIDFSTGHIGYGYRNDVGFIRCVRSVDNTSDEIWTDTNTGLMWQVEPMGYNMIWSDASDHCDGLTLAGYSGWHLPTISELRSLIKECDATETGGSCGVIDNCLDYSGCWDDSCSGCSEGGGSADGCYWPSQIEGSCTTYWSSSPVADYNYSAWGVNFDEGCVEFYSSGGYDDVPSVRCVR